MEQQPRTLQSFSSGGARYAVFTEDVITITEWREPAVLPRAPASVLGVVSIHGRMLTVLDLLPLVDSRRRTKSPSHILALAGDEQLALAIDDPGERIEDANAAGDEARANDLGKLITRVIDCNGAEIRMLNVKELFPTAIQGRERRRRRF